MPKPTNILYSLREENMDIYTLPIDCPPPNSIIVTGDSHGRFTKLMYELLKFCVITNITYSHHQELIAIQQKSGDELSAEDLTLFETIMSWIVVNRTLKIILTDDFFADRGDSDQRNYVEYKGGNDYLNLKFLEVLSLAKIIVGICYSNHGVELIDRHERGLNFTESRFQIIYDHFFNTARQLQRLIDRQLIDRRRQVDPLIKEHYIAHIQVLIYVRDFLITHAPVGLVQVEKLAQQFNVSIPYDIQSEEFKWCQYEQHKLVQMVNAVNTIFKSHARNGTIHTLHDYYNYDPVNNMLDLFTHNRDREGLKRSNCLPQINGHDIDTKGLDPSNVFTLNSPLGQGRCPEKTCTGINRVVILYPQPQEEQYTDDALNYAELWNSIYDIYYSLISGGANGFIMGAALGLFGNLLEKYTRLEQKKINQLKGVISGILIVYGMLVRDSDELQALIWNTVIRYIVQAVLPIATQNVFFNITATNTTVSMAMAASSSNTWTSFFSTTFARTASSISAYYGYSLGSKLFSSSGEQNLKEAEQAALKKENSDLKQENKNLIEKITLLEKEKNTPQPKANRKPKELEARLSSSQYPTFSASKKPSGTSNERPQEVSQIVQKRRKNS